MVSIDTSQFRTPPCYERHSGESKKACPDLFIFYSGRQPAPFHPAGQK